MSWKSTLVIIAALACFALGWLCCLKTRPVTHDFVQVDTLYIRDTLRVVEPREVARTVKCVSLVSVRDTIRYNDTVYVQLPIEQKVYEDSSYRAVVSGWRPSLDTLEIFRSSAVITQQIRSVQKARKVGFSLQAGIGAQYGICSGRFDVGPYVGVGVHYRF